ncbi:hypothetical protein KO566_10680 [Flavobacteriaceae bacterium XHP0103]|uniref:hypothetical protein n=1 Tax=Marixanthotalea marina TaxID=2844359 RepID=UPI002989A585|nr:hypothetical protein [Marixanthotalea marina]MBU3822529.1 hypothetical protein [Marixanthotalea marina]
MSEIAIYISIIIPIYAGLAFLANKKYDKFTNIHAAIFFISILLSAIMFSWNMALTELYRDVDFKLNRDFSNHDLIKKIELIKDENSFKTLYFVIIVLTVFYLQLLEFVFKPESSKEKPQVLEEQKQKSQSEDK